MGRPRGFGVLAGCAVVLGLVLARELYYGSEGMPCLFLAPAAALALVTAEALWRVRPWAFRACLVLAWMLAGVPVAAGILGFSLKHGGPAALVAAGTVSAYATYPVVTYVRRRIRLRYAVT
ncbi:MAG TPA: hypothetical protein VF541_04725 [Longimicrobium sp.]|jgi:hypothetical protein